MVNKLYWSPTAIDWRHGSASGHEMEIAQRNPKSAIIMHDQCKFGSRGHSAQ